MVTSSVHGNACHSEQWCTISAVWCWRTLRKLCKFELEINNPPSWENWENSQAVLEAQSLERFTNQKAYCIFMYSEKKLFGCGSRTLRSLDDTEMTHKTQRGIGVVLCVYVCVFVCPRVRVLMHLLLKECYFEIEYVASFLRQAWSWTHHVANLKLPIILLSRLLSGITGVCYLA